MSVFNTDCELYDYDREYWEKLTTDQLNDPTS